MMMMMKERNPNNNNNKTKQFRNELDSTPGPSDTSRRSTGGLINLWQRRLLAKLEY